MTSNGSDRTIIILLILILLIPIVLTILFSATGEPGQLPTATASPTQEATVKPTLPTLTSSPMLTAVNTTPTDDPTPTPEVAATVFCHPHYAAETFTFAVVYYDWQLLHPMDWELPPHTPVLLLEARGYAYRVVTATGDRIEGWIPYYTLPVECQP